MCSPGSEQADYVQTSRAGYPAYRRWGVNTSVLSDNGAIYTAAYRGARSGLELELAVLDIAFKHGKPYHP
jgi:hypothetical protein